MQERMVWSCYCCCCCPTCGDTSWKCSKICIGWGAIMCILLCYDASCWYNKGNSSPWESCNHALIFLSKIYPTYKKLEKMAKRWLFGWKVQLPRAAASLKAFHISPTTLLWIWHDKNHQDFLLWEGRSVVLLFNWWLRQEDVLVHIILSMAGDQLWLCSSLRLCIRFFFIWILP